MNSADADRQIEQMIAFIAQEAREKAEEINIKTEKEFMAEKLSQETQASIAIRAEHDKHRKEYQIQKRIEKSKALTAARFATMRHRDDKINDLKREVLSRLADVSKDAKYSELMRFLIAQGLMTLLENKVVIKVRQEDINIAKKELPTAINLFQDTLQKASGVTPSVDVKIDASNFLPPGPTKNSSAASCAGGVELAAREGQILVRNTLDHRLDIAFEKLKPTIRGILFGVREVLVGKKPAETHKGAVSLPK